MNNADVARIFEEVAAMMELAGENPFKIRAYENAAKLVSGLQGDLAQAVGSGRLRQARGIGDALFANLQEILATGGLTLHDELEAQFPTALRECLRLPGIGAKKLKLLREQLGIESMESLERACLEGRLASVPGFGPKTAAKLLESIAVLRRGAGYELWARAWQRAEQLAAAVAATGLAGRVEIAGRLRRRLEITQDIVLVASTDRVDALRSAAEGLSEARPTSSSGADLRLSLPNGAAASLTIVFESDFCAALLAATGSRDHVEELRKRATARGLILERAGLFRAGSRVKIPTPREEDVYTTLGLPWIPPELREGAGEIEAAERGELPVLVEASDLRGLIHIHTTDSDGRDDLETMIAAVRRGGYRYAAITDHSQSAAYARGLSPERVLAQRARLRALRDRHPDITLFHGTEADILADGSIDYGDEFLEGFDLVVASVHSRFGLSRQEQTERLRRAVRNPFVSVLGHPSGRLLLSRQPLSADWEAVFADAAESGCAIEINCNPERLDLDWRLCRAAARAGILLSIDPDAHSAGEIERVREGVSVARKGWVTAESVLNTRDAAALSDWLARRRGKPLRG